jgi:hypothetical protein
VANIKAYCTAADLSRVVEAATRDPDNIPEELFVGGGKVAVALVWIAAEAGMKPEDISDIKEGRLWDNGKVDVLFNPEVSMSKREKWHLAIQRARNKILEKYPKWKLQ